MLRVLLGGSPSTLSVRVALCKGGRLLSINLNSASIPCEDPEKISVLSASESSQEKDDGEEDDEEVLE
jgi:hypothetical protein